MDQSAPGTAPTLRNSCSAAEWEARVDLAAAYRYAEMEGWHDLIFNHITVRVPGEPEHFLVKPHELMFREVTASCLLKMDMEGKVIGESTSVNPAAATVHTAVYIPRPDVNAVAHVHGKAGMALSIRKTGLRCLNQESMLFYNRVSYHDFEGIATDLEERRRMGAALGVNNTMILRNHGLLTCGDTLQEAVIRMRHLVMAAEVQLAVESSGAEINEPSPEVCERTAKQSESAYKRTRYRPQWEAVLRLVDEERPGFRV